jgi:hypothetical protein
MIDVRGREMSGLRASEGEVGLGVGSLEPVRYWRVVELMGLLGDRF